MLSWERPDWSISVKHVVVVLPASIEENKALTPSELMNTLSMLKKKSDMDAADYLAKRERALAAEYDKNQAKVIYSFMNKIFIFCFYSSSYLAQCLSF